MKNLSIIIVINENNRYIIIKAHRVTFFCFRIKNVCKPLYDSRCDLIFFKKSR